MSSFELTFSPERPGRNPVTGRFLPGHTPANKGRKWDEYCSKSAQRRMRKGWKNLDLYRGHPDNAGRPARAVIAIHGQRQLFFKSINDAAAWCGGQGPNVRRCCRLNASPATVRHPDHPNTDHRYKGVRFYYESDFSTWSAKIDQPK